MVGTAIETIMMSGHVGLVLYSDAEKTCVANIGLGLFAANIGLWSAIAEFVEGGQQAYGSSSTPFPVVAAPSGLALGGGCESLLASDAIQAQQRAMSDCRRPVSASSRRGEAARNAPAPH